MWRNPGISNGRPSTLRRDIKRQLYLFGELTAIDLASRLGQKITTVRRMLQRMSKDTPCLRYEVLHGIKLWRVT